MWATYDLSGSISWLRMKIFDQILVKNSKMPSFTDGWNSCPPLAGRLILTTNCYKAFIVGFVVNICKLTHKSLCLFNLTLVLVSISAFWKLSKKCCWNYMSQMKTCFQKSFIVIHLLCFAANGMAMRVNRFPSIPVRPIKIAQTPADIEKVFVMSDG